MVSWTDCMLRLTISDTSAAWTCGAVRTSRGTVRRTLLEAGQGAVWRPRMPKRDPFKYFNASPEIICLAVMLYIRFPLSL